MKVMCRSKHLSRRKDVERERKRWFVSFARINMSFSARINASSWLEKPFKTIFSSGFCHITCRDILAHLFVSDESRKQASNLPDNLALAEKKALAERRHFLPGNLAAICEKACFQCCSLLLWQVSDVTPGYAADVIRWSGLAAWQDFWQTGF